MTAVLPPGIDPALCRWCRTEPPVGTITWACVHEHIADVPLCWSCSQDQSIVTHRINCYACAHGPETHLCRSTEIRRTGALTPIPGYRLIPPITL